MHLSSIIKTRSQSAPELSDRSHSRKKSGIRGSKQVEWIQKSDLLNRVINPSEMAFRYFPYWYCLIFKSTEIFDRICEEFNRAPSLNKQSYLLNLCHLLIQWKDPLSEPNQASQTLAKIDQLACKISSNSLFPKYEKKIEDEKLRMNDERFFFKSKNFDESSSSGIELSNVSSEQALIQEPFKYDINQVIRNFLSLSRGEILKNYALNLDKSLVEPRVDCHDPIFTVQILGNEIISFQKYLFTQLTPHDFTKEKSIKSYKERIATYSNNLSALLKKLMEQQEEDNQLKLIFLFHLLRNYLIEKRDFQSGFEIYASLVMLNPSSIKQFKKYYIPFDKTDKETSTLFNVQDNHKNLREHFDCLRKNDHSFIPLLQIALKDINLVLELFKKEGTKELFNLEMIYQFGESVNHTLSPVKEFKTQEIQSNLLPFLKELFKESPAPLA